VPAPSAAVVAIRKSPAVIEEDANVLRSLHVAANVGAVPPEPCADHALDLIRSIWIGTPAAKNVVDTAADNRTFIMIARFVACDQRNWKISLLAVRAAGNIPVNPAQR